MSDDLSAFPQPFIEREGRDGYHIVSAEDVGLGGMSLRDYFAGQALMGMCALGSEGWTPGRLIHEDAMAVDAYAFADAMLKARQKEGA